MDLSIDLENYINALLSGVVSYSSSKHYLPVEVKELIRLSSKASESVFPIQELKGRFLN